MAETRNAFQVIQNKLPGLLALRYYTTADAVAELGSVESIRRVFIGFQKHLYEHRDIA